MTLGPPPNLARSEALPPPSPRPFPAGPSTLPAGLPVGPPVQRSKEPSPDRRRLRRGAAAVGTLGSGLAIAGTFLPWLASGATERNSYQLSGVAARFAVAGPGPGQVVLAGWPLLGPLLLLPVLIGALRWWVAAGALAVVLGTVTAGFGMVVTLLGAGRATAGVSAIRTGPITFAIGGTLLLAGGVVLLFAAWPGKMVRTSRAVGSPPFPRPPGDSGPPVDPGGPRP